jgi:hypothetical protein
MLMIKVELFLGLVSLALCIYCVVSIISSRDDEIRHLPKIGWLILVLLFPLVGSIAWLAVGRPVAVQRPPSRYERSAPEFPEYDRPGRAAAVDPEADAEFLRKVRERAEEQRRKAKEQQKSQRPEPTEDETS